jgi:hypothetical protein
MRLPLPARQPAAPLTTCPTCNHRFRTELVERPDGTGAIGEVTCPHCAAVYVAYRIDATGLAARAPLAAARAAFDDAAVKRFEKLLQKHITPGPGVTKRTPVR